MFYFAVLEFAHFTIYEVSSAHTPNWNACVCVGVDVCVHADWLVYPHMFLCTCSFVSLVVVGRIFMCKSVRKISRKFICVWLMHMTTPPKGGKKQTAIKKKKKQVTIQLQCDSWMVPYLKWTTEAVHGTRRHLVTFTVWWFTLNACLEFVPWKSGFHCS